MDSEVGKMFFLDSVIKEVSCMQKQVQQQLPQSDAAVQSCDITTTHSNHCRNEKTSLSGRYREKICQVVFLLIC